MTDATYLFYQTQRESSKIARGAHGMTHGSRPKAPRLSVKGESSDVTIKQADGSYAVIPLSWFFKKTGLLKKNRQEEYNQLMSK
jgi:hypothetical protein